MLEVQLHGYSDASQIAYGAVIYACYLHQDSTVTVALITAKTKVAPVKELSIPRLELCGAKLLAQLLTTTAREMNIPIRSFMHGVTPQLCLAGSGHCLVKGQCLSGKESTRSTNSSPGDMYQLTKIQSIQLLEEPFPLNCWTRSFGEKVQTGRGSCQMNG